MALDTYTELETALKSYCDREDTSFTAQIPTFVALTEHEIFDDLEVREMIVNDQLVCTDGELILAEDQREFKYIQLDADKRVLVDFSAPKQVQKFQQEAFEVGGKIYGTVNGDTISLAPPPPDGTTFNVVIKSLPTALSANQQTNSIFPQYNQIYWAGMLSQAFLFMRAEEKAALWEAKFQSYIAKANQRFKRENMPSVATAIPSRVV